MRRTGHWLVLTLGGCWEQGPPPLSAEADREVRALIAQAEASGSSEDWRTAAARLEAEGRTLQAADALLRAGVVKDAPPAVRGDLAQIYVELGYEDAVARELQACLQASPREPECLLAFGEFLEASQSPAALRQARRVYSAFLDAAPDDHPARSRVQSSLAQLGGRLQNIPPPPGALSDPSAPEAAAPTPEETKPGLNEFGAALARALQAAREGRTADAVAGFKAALQLEPDNPGGLAGLAEAQLANGNVQASVAAMGRALEVAGEDPQVLFVAGALAQRRGDLAEARTHWSKLRALHPPIAEQLGISERLASMAGGGGQVSAPGPAGRMPADGTPDRP
ncbi:MAG: tetratricopeptide repeat protein [Myxococcota bacterium]